MYKIVSSISAIAGISTSAAAHAGEHGSFDFFEAVYHFIASPVHIGIALVLVAVAVCLRTTAKRQQR